jgi:hypothetical protein
MPKLCSPHPPPARPIIASHRGFPAPSHQCRAIYADRPWTFQNRSDKGTGRNATSHYECLDYHQLASPSVADLAAKHCALFLWAVDPLLDRAMDLIRGMGLYLQNRRLLLGETQSQRQIQRRILHRTRLLDPRKPRTMPARHTRKPAPPRPRRQTPRRRSPPPAQPKTRLHPNSHRALARRPPPRNEPPSPPRSRFWALPLNGVALYSRCAAQGARPGLRPNGSRSLTQREGQQGHADRRRRRAVPAILGSAKRADPLVLLHPLDQIGSPSAPRHEPRERPTSRTGREPFDPRLEGFGDLPKASIWAAPRLLDIALTGASQAFQSWPVRLL